MENAEIDIERTILVRNMGEKILEILSKGEDGIDLDTAMNVMSATMACIFADLPRNQYGLVMADYFDRVQTYTKEMRNDA